MTFKWVHFRLETDILGNAFLGALTLPCYGHIPPRQCSHLRTHSKNVPLSLTRPYALGKLLLFFDLGTYGAHGGRGRREDGTLPRQVRKRASRGEARSRSPHPSSYQRDLFCGTGAPKRTACAPPISADGCARPIATAPRHRGVAWIFQNNTYGRARPPGISCGEMSPRPQEEPEGTGSWPGGRRGRRTFLMHDRSMHAVPT